MRNRDALHERIAEVLAPRSKDEIQQRATECRIPLGVVQSFEDVLADAHLAERGRLAASRQPVRHDPLAAPALAHPRRDAPGACVGTGPVQRPRRGRRRLVVADGPLRGIRILDLTHVWAGPLATRILADLGAAVVKVEKPHGARSPDVPRRPAHRRLAWAASRRKSRGTSMRYSSSWQRNKQSVAMDLKTAAGRAAFLDLVQVADVVMENFSARAMPALDLDYPRLAEANPKIVYVAMPGYGKSGPYRDRVAFGPTVEPMSGLTTVMGYGPDEPRNTAMALMDPITGVNAAAAVLDALRQRERTGRGAYVEMSLHEGGVAFCGPWLVDAQLGRHPRSAGATAIRRWRPTASTPAPWDDAWIAVACRNDADWRALCEVVAGLRAEADRAERVAVHDEIDAAIGAWTGERTKDEAAQLLLQRAGVPAGPVNITPDMTADPQVRARGFFVPLESGPTPMPGNPIKMAGIDRPRLDALPAPRRRQRRRAARLAGLRRGSHRRA